MIYDSGTLFLDGDVGNLRDQPYFTAADVRTALKRHGTGPLNVSINSGGGYCDEGVAIYNALKNHPAAVTVIVEGMAASAGSLIAMAGDVIVMRSGSTMMIHDPSRTVYGNASELVKVSKVVDMLANEMAKIYAARSRKTVEAVRKLMIIETWFSGGEAVAQGFADRVDEGMAKAVARFDYLQYRHPPQDIAAHAGWGRIAARMNTRDSGSPAGAVAPASVSSAGAWADLAARMNNRQN